MALITDNSATVLWVSENNSVLGTGIKAHSHEYYHMFLVRKGPVGFLVDKNRIVLKDGGFIIIPPGMTHGMDPITVDPYAMLYEIKFAVSGARLRRLLSSIPQIFEKDEFVEKLTQLIVEECSCGKADSPSVGTDYLLTLINYVYKFYGTVEDSDTKYIDTTGFSMVSVDIVKYLENHFTEDIPLQDVASEVGFNKNYICSVFKKDSNMTIGSCLTMIRIRKAAELISFSDMNLSQVAAATGFTNFSHFNRIFKKVVGIPPGQYRCMYTVDMLINGRGSGMVNADKPGFISAVMAGKKIPSNQMSTMIELKND